MGVPKVTYKTRERGVLASPFNGITGALAGEFETGPLTPQLVTSRDDFLNKYTKTGSVPLDGCTEYYSALAFLEESNSLLVLRVTKHALHGGISAGKKVKPFVTGYENPAEEYDFKNNKDVDVIFYSKYPTNQKIVASITSYRETEQIADMIKYLAKGTDDLVEIAPTQDFVKNEKILFSFDAVGQKISEASKAEVQGTKDMSAGFDWEKTPQEFALSVDGSDLKSIQLTVKTDTIEAILVAIRNAIKSVELTGIKVISVEDKFVKFETEREGRTAIISLVAGKADALKTLGFEPGTHHGTDEVVTKESKIGNIVSGENYYLIPIDDGKYNLTDRFSGKPIKWIDSKIIKEIPGVLSSSESLEEGTFEINVKVNGNNSIVETFICSLDKNKKDGFGNSLFVENVLDASAYIGATVSMYKPEKVTVPTPDMDFIEFFGGDEGQQPTAADRLKAVKQYFLRKDFDIFILLDGGYTVKEYHIGLISVAEQRQDCEAILTTPISAERSADYLNKIISYRRYEINANSDCGELFSPHLSITDEFNNRSIKVGCDGYVGARIAFTARNFEVWYPVAGESRRGQILVNDTEIHFSEGEMNELDRYQINPIWFDPGRGIKIWNQKTLKATASLTQFANIKFLELYLKRVIIPSLRSFLFELNTPATRVSAYNLTNGIMQDVQARDGIYGFTVVCDSSNNPQDGDLSILNINLVYQPVRGIREVVFVATKTVTGDTSLKAIAY